MDRVNAYSLDKHSKSNFLAVRNCQESHHTTYNDNRTKFPENHAIIVIKFALFHDKLNPTFLKVEDCVNKVPKILNDTKEVECKWQRRCE